MRLKVAVSLDGRTALANGTSQWITGPEARADVHRWFLKNQFIWLHWFGKMPGHALRREVPLQFQEGRLYISWAGPENGTGVLVLERSADLN